MDKREISTGGFLDPERIVQYFGLEKGDYVADFGAGHGFFVIPIARTVGNNGRVYAIDIQKPVLEIIKAKAKIAHLLNIETIWSDLDTSGGSRIKDSFVDLVFVANILFQAEKKDVLMQEAFRVLRSGGRMAAIEWDSPENINVRTDVSRSANGSITSPLTTSASTADENKQRSNGVNISKFQVGPPVELRLKKEHVKILALQAGFRLDREFEAGTHHYGLLFKKP